MKIYKAIGGFFLILIIVGIWIATQKVSTVQPKTNLQDVVLNIEEPLSSDYWEETEWKSVYQGEDSNLGCFTYYGVHSQKDRHREQQQAESLEGRVTRNIVTTRIGNTVYEDKVGRLYVLSGTKPLFLEKNNIPIESIQEVREEGTGRKIDIYKSEQELEESQQRTETGKAILSGRQKGDAGTILLNHQIIEKDKFLVQPQAKTYWVPLEALLEQMSYPYRSSDMGISVFINQQNMMIYSHYYSSAQDNWAREKAPDGYWSYSGYGHKPWKDHFPVMQKVDNIYFADAVILNRIFGWEVMTNGTCLSIITDPLDIAERRVVYRNEAVAYHPDSVGEMNHMG